MTVPDDASQKSTEEIGEIVSTLHDAGEGHSPSVRDIIKRLGQASFGALLLVPAMIIATPASGIPGLPTVCGLIIALIAIQMLTGRDHIWLPDWVMERRIDGDRFERALDFLQRPVGWIDYLSRPRMTWLLRWPMVLPLQLVCVFCGLAMPFMEWVPLTSSIAAIAVCLVAVAFIADDGLLALAGVAVAVAGAAAFIQLAGHMIAGVFG
ncbi:exopolysaccharide biosynthesis protein [Roseinatronobacter alkalisoli]|uniref:Exopolysaccharide biosynthesis protein n=1 Tax=Roseinatronobacter alkalisoli TaxID=3028235 RepID=A0ABT5TAX7_9RHOB|nr:exopolysaccharide biosynthesis protein [Roseinatronobacter sp. HJB301]MDD7971088.1 exopolysaccharide biosynthesis protein [Roseinatronobacter sp. HJB301]